MIEEKQKSDAFVQEMISRPAKPKVELQLYGGGTCLVDADIAPIIMEVERKIQDDARAFHDKLLSLGVKAYRVNDGWVDRKRRIVTLFEDDYDIGYYYRGLKEINVGDLIAIGDVSDGAMIVRVVELDFPGMHCIRLRYGEEVISVEDGIKNGVVVKSKYHAPAISKLMSKIGFAEPHRYPIYE